MGALPLSELLGLPPQLRDYLADLAGALSGDLVIHVSPATLGSSAATINAGSFSRDVAVELRNAAGARHVWFSGTLSVAVADVTAGSGTSAVADSATTVELTNGAGSVTIDYSGTWAAADTQTTTISGTVLGKSLTSQTSVDTVVA